jgi:CYTH domain-containing protein
MEIERKFLVDKDHLPTLETNVRIEQHYLNDIEDKWLVRLRQWDDRYFLELKTKGDLSREELKFKITEDEYLKGIEHSIKKLRKTRYLLFDQDLAYEVDIYDDYDFITVEVEFESEEEANNFVPPSWFGQDITNDYKYRNNNLAK